MKYYCTFETIIGELYLVADEHVLTAIYLDEEDFRCSEKKDEKSISIHPEHSLLKECTRQLQEYFSGNRQEFHLPLKLEGTLFQKQVWDELLKIPYGQTRSYFDIAVSIGKQKAVRAIGQANKANRYPIIIPCHRVIGKNNSLTGYAGTKIEIKEKLLSHEGALPKKL